MGGFIDNSGGPTAAPVTVNKVGLVDSNNGYWNNGWGHRSDLVKGGLEIHSRGSVTINRLLVQNNLGKGLFINNIPASGAGAAVSVTDSSFIHNRVGHWEDTTWVGDDLLSNEDGLYIESKGLVTLTNITAEDNDGYGVYVANNQTGATAGVTINAGRGLGILLAEL